MADTSQTSAAGGLPIWSALGVPLGYQQITLSGATLLTVPAGAKLALISVSTAAARYRDDGTAPTATVGFPLPITTTTPFVYSGNLATVQFIAQTGSPILDICYYG